MNNGKVAVVTGAGAGIGRAIALQLANDGFSLTVNDIRDEMTHAVAREARDLGVECLGVTADVSSEEQVRKMMDDTFAAHGRIDVLVNNAGICPVRNFADITPEDMLKTFNVNVVSMLLCAQAAVPYMKQREKGKIINAASQSAFRQSEFTMEYGASKWAIRGFTRSLALHLAQYNITVNAYCPGTVRSEMNEHIAQVIGARKGISAEEHHQATVRLIPLKRLQPAEDIAKLVSFLASDAADNMTGQNILLNGGQVMN